MCMIEFKVIVKGHVLAMHKKENNVHMWDQQALSYLGYIWPFSLPKFQSFTFPHYQAHIFSLMCLFAISILVNDGVTGIVNNG